MKFCLLICFLFTSLNSFSKSVFLVEGSSGKHVGISSDNSTFKILTSGSDWHLYPTISNDGSLVAYAKGPSAKELQLVIENLNTRKKTILTTPSFLIQPAFSKRSQRLFFAIEKENVPTIGYIDLKVSKKVNLIKTKYPSFFPAPFEDGERIVFQRNKSQSKKEIVILNIITKEEKVIGEGMSPALSTDERFVAYTSKVSGHWDIYVYDRFKLTTSQITNSKVRDFSPSFDKDNNLFYTSDRLENGVFSIYSQKLNSWTQTTGVDTLNIQKKGVSFYAPKFSGENKYKIALKAQLEGEAKSSFGTINHNGRVYTIGGHQGPEHTYPPESFSNRVSAFDIKSNKWFELAPRSYKAHGFQLAASGNFIYAFGGFAYEGSTKPAWKSIDVVERYDILKNKWEELAPMPRKRSSNALAIIDSKVYLFGGWDATPKFENDIDGKFHSEVDVFDMATEEWNTLDVELPKKRRAFSAFVRADQIYLLGGISEGGSHFSLSDDFTHFNPQLNTFSEMPKLPFGTFAPAAGALKNEGFMFGGMFQIGKFDYEYVPHIYKFNFKTKKWSHTGRYLVENKGFSQVVNLAGNCLGILGGHSYTSGEDRPVNTFEKFCSK